MPRSAAILTIGSLFWSSKQHRQAWRQTRLMDTPTRVRVPIRYGRRSSGGIYSMVFSNSLLPSQFGWALAVPCRRAVHTFADLLDEARALWAAEQRGFSSGGPLAADWGAVGILANPSRTGLASFMAEWSATVAGENEIYRKFPHDACEAPAVTPDGVLAIPWPTMESGDPLNTDFMLATANRPTTPYAAPQMIADACRASSEGRRYFDETRRVGIRTAFDDEILQCLESTG